MEKSKDKFLTGLPLVLFVVLFFFADPSMAKWQNSGPGGTWIDSIIVDSGNSSILYAGTNGGVFKSIDAGLTWTYKALRFEGVDVITQIPSGCSSAGALLAGSGRTLYASTDSGESWSLLGPAGAQISDVAVATTFPSCRTYTATDDGVYVYDGTTSTLNLSGKRINTLAVDPANVVYAGTDDGEVYKSSDNGVSWSQILTGEYFIEDIAAVDTDHIFITSVPSGIRETADGGAHWTTATTGLPDISSSGVFAANAISTGATNTLYVGVTTSVSPLTNTIYKSVDNGAHWSATNNSATHEYEIRSIAVSPAGTVYLGTYFGLIKSTDGGSHWLDLTGGIDAAYINNSIVEDSRGVLFAAGRGRGIYSSTDGGVTWTAVGSGHPSSVTSILVDRTDDSLYCTDEQIGGVYKSTDHGITWQLSSQGLPSDSMGGALTLYHEVTSLSQGGSNRIYAGLDEGAVYYSGDQGATWTAATALLAGGMNDEVTSIVGGTGETVYVGTRNNGVFKSVDGGTTWSRKNNGLPSVNSNISRQGIILDSSTGHLFLSLFGGSIYRSNDGGDSWVATTDPVTGCGSNSVALDSSNNLYGVYCFGTVYKSSDSGATWTEMSEGLGLMDNVEGLKIGGIFADHQDTMLLTTGNKGIYRFSAPQSASFPWPSFLPAILHSHQ